MSRAKNGSSTKIGVVWQKSDFLAKNWNFGPKKREPLLYSNHVLATTRKSCSKKKVAFAQIIKGENVILGDNYLDKGNFFLWTTFSVRGQNMFSSKKWVFWGGPKCWFLVQKSDFCHTTPILVDDPFLALGMTVNFPPWKPFFDFPFRS